MPLRQGTPGNERLRTSRVQSAGRWGAVVVLMVLAASCGTNGSPSGKQPFKTAPASARVDLSEPTFSNPTSITNPMFPIGTLAQVVQLGEEGGKPVRVEITLLPATKTVTWKGRPIEARVSQFLAIRDGRIVEAAVDFFAQADDGSVWYLGEEVDNYSKGVVANHGGSWLAGKDGPAGMIMPAAPKVGDVYRPENIPDLVFEEVIVKSVDETLDGPRGRVQGVMLIREFLMEGGTEDKAFAPGYGEFRARAEDELVTVAVAVPTDAVPGPPPAELSAVSGGALAVFDAAAASDWSGISATLGRVTAAWTALQAGDLPPLLEAQLTRALEALTETVGARKSADVRRRATGLLEAALDLELRHRPVAEVDLARLGLWARRVLLAASAEDHPGVAGGVATLETVWKRVGHVVDAQAAGRVNTHLRDLRAAADRKDAPAASAAVPALLGTLAGLRPSA